MVTLNRGTTFWAIGKKFQNYLLKSIQNYFHTHGKPVTSSFLESFPFLPYTPVTNHSIKKKRKATTDRSSSRPPQPLPRAPSEFPSPVSFLVAGVSFFCPSSFASHRCNQAGRGCRRIDAPSRPPPTTGESLRRGDEWRRGHRCLSSSTTGESLRKGDEVRS